MHPAFDGREALPGHSQCPGPAWPDAFWRPCRPKNRNADSSAAFHTSRRMALERKGIPLQTKGGRKPYARPLTGRKLYWAFTMPRACVAGRTPFGDPAAQKSRKENSPASFHTSRRMALERKGIPLQTKGGRKPCTRPLTGRKFCRGIHNAPGLRGQTPFGDPAAQKTETQIHPPPFTQAGEWLWRGKESLCRQKAAESLMPGL